MYRSISDEAKIEYAMLHVREALRNMRTARFEKALDTVSNYHAGE